MHRHTHKHTHTIDRRDSFCEKWALRMGKKEITRTERGLQLKGG